MMKFVLHPEAFADFNEIWEHIATDSPDAADRVLDEMYEAITSLARFHRLATLALISHRDPCGSRLCAIM